MRLIIDFIRRWKYFYIIAIVFAAWFFNVFGKTHRIFPLAIYLGTMMLSFDYAKNSVRVLAALPLSRSEIGRSWFHLGVTLPVLLFSAIRLIVIAAASRGAFDPQFFIIFSLWDLSYSGATYFLLSFQPIGLGGSGIWGGVWGLAYGSVALAQFLPGRWNEFSPWSAIAMLLGLGLTAAAYFRSTAAAADRIAFRPHVKAAAAERSGRFSIGDSLVGVPQMLWTFLAGIALASVMFFVVFGFVDLVIHRQTLKTIILEDTLLERIQTAGPFGQSVIYWFTGTMLVFGTGWRVALSMRELRALPVSASKLTFICLAPTWLAGLIVWLVPAAAALALPRQGPGLAYYLWFFVFAGLCTIGNVFLLNSKGRMGATMLTMMLLEVGIGLGHWALTGAARNPVAIVAALVFAAITTVAGIVLARSFITGSSRAYKATELTFMTAWQRR